MEVDLTRCSGCPCCEKSVSLKCGHGFCGCCLVKFVYEILLFFEEMLNRSIDSMQKKVEKIKCKFGCEESELDLNTVKVFVDGSPLTPDEKINFFRLSKLGEFYFSGVAGIFFICQICKTLKSDNDERMVVCKDCVFDLCLKQTGCVPKEIRFVNGEEKAKMNFSDWQAGEFCLLKLTNDISCFEFADCEKNLVQIWKLRSITHKMEVALVNVNIVGEPRPDLLQFHEFDDMHAISTFKLYLDSPNNQNSGSDSGSDS